MNNYNNIFKCLEEKYRYLLNYLNYIDNNIFNNPSTCVIKGRTYLEYLAREIAIINNIQVDSNITQLEKLNILSNEGILNGEILSLFHEVRKIGNAVVNTEIEGELVDALRIHRDIYKITCWFVKTHIDYKFEAPAYENPMLVQQSSPSFNMESLKSLMKENVQEVLNDSNNKTNTNYEERDNEIDDAFMGLIAESIVNSEKVDKKCLVQELEKLKESSKEAVESLNDFTPFKKYMHVSRDAQIGLDDIIHKANESKNAQLILVCGSVGDGKSHIISYFKSKYEEIMNNFTLHNDATESLEPSKTSMDTLNELLDDFSDEKIQNSNKKIILAINLGTLNNFIDSDYGERFTKLKQFVINKKILESSIEDNSFSEESNFQYVNFSDYHLFTLSDGKVKSSYIKQIINKITQSHEINLHESNYFYFSYKNNCQNCSNKDICPIKINYELLSMEKVQDSVIDLLVQCIVKNKIIISTRALLNFIYEIIVPRSYIDVNSPTFKNKISQLNLSEYINSLMPNTIFNHKELSFIFESLSRLDPLNVRNEKVDDFIVDFNNDNDVIKYFEEYIDYSNIYLNKIGGIDLNNTENKKLRFELLRLFIRSYYICSKNELFSLRDEVYDEYIYALFNFNKGDKIRLRSVYDNVKEGIMKWNGEANKDYLNIFIGRNQTKYKISEKIQLKADTKNLRQNDESDLKKFIGTLTLQYRNVVTDKIYAIDIDYSLYKLLLQVNSGYRPNKKDKNHFINFIEFVSKLEDIGSQDKELVIVEKNREKNKQYKLEFDDEFETYRFVEIE